MTKKEKEFIANQNDIFRSYLGAKTPHETLKGQYVITHGISQLEMFDRMAILLQVKTFDKFTKGDDPYGLRDFGAFKFDGERVFWKIDCYDTDFAYASENPADPTQTRRILTVMFGYEW